jgi:hypothetical protein
MATRESDGKAAVEPRAGGLAALCLVVLALLASTVAIAPGIGAAVEEEHGGLRLLGKLVQPKEAYDDFTKGTVKLARIDVSARRLYYFYGDRRNMFHIREYDVRTPIPSFVRDAIVFPSTIVSPTGIISPKTITIDTRRRRMLLVNNTCSVPCDGGLPSVARVEIIDLKTLKAVGSFDLQTSAPGTQLYGMTYSEEDDRLYFVGEMEPVQGLGVVRENPSGVIPATVTVVVAIEPETGRLAWMRLVPECQIPMANRIAGALIARSKLRPALYFGCVRPLVYPGESGVLRMTITPGATLVDVARFKTELFPISGSYVMQDGIQGNGDFDYATDRVFMQSIALRTPGAWVFDGSLSAWVGFIGSPDSNARRIGFDEQSGRYYAGSDSPEPPSYVVAADGRSSPVPQGRVFPLPGTLQSEILTDPMTRRLFMQINVSRGGNEFEVFVYEDTSALPKPPMPTDYDALTVDVPEGPQTASNFAGDTNGFGVRALLVGGLGGARSACSGTGGDVDQCEAIYSPIFAALSAASGLDLNLSPADRGFFASRVASLDVRNVGASASANALELDSVTSGEYVTKLQEPAAARVEEHTNEEARASVERMLAWPHTPATCLDSGGNAEPQEKSGPGGGSTVSCDLSKPEASASTRFTAFSVGGVSVASSSFDSRARKDPALGIVTESTAVAKGIVLTSPDGASATIGEIVTVATTAARGRPKTASAAWSRTFSNVVVRDSSGNKTFQCTDADSCDPRAVVAAMNEVLSLRMRVYLPEADRITTPEGAFAGVQKSNADFLNSSTVNNDNSGAVPALEIVVFNDSVEKSRVLIQLAAIQASSIYGIALLPGDTGFSPGPGLVPPIPPLLPDVLPPTSGPPAGTVTTGPPRSPGAKLLSAALFLFRSPKDALLVGLTALLFVGAATVAARRRTLLRQLEGGT